MYEHGWFAVGFEREMLAAPRPTLARATVAGRRFLVVDGRDGLRAFDADCPHRGADLSMGVLDGGCVVCPFHGYRIALGSDAAGDFVATELPVLVAAGLVFVRLSDSHDHGLPGFLEELGRSHSLVPCFELSIAAPAETVIENGFDQRHFDAVHGIRTRPFTTTVDASGALVATGAFHVPAVGRYTADHSERTATLGYRATAFSPGVIAVELTGSNPYTVVTAATPTAEGTCAVRLVLALPVDVYGPTPEDRTYRYLIDYSRRGLEQDRLVWESLNPRAPQRFTRADGAVRAFHEFCAAFRPGAAVP